MIMEAVFNFIVFLCALMLIVFILSKEFTERRKHFSKIKWESKFSRRHLKIVKKDINK